MQNGARSPVQAGGVCGWAAGERAMVEGRECCLLSATRLFPCHHHRAQAAGMSTPDNGAGPSSAPIFKKRATRPKDARAVRALSDERAQDAGGQGDDGAGQGDDGEEQAYVWCSTRESESKGKDSVVPVFSLSVDDLVKLRALRSKPQGIDLDRLNKGEERRRRKKKNQQDDKDHARTEEERWEEQMRQGGLVRRGDVYGGGRAQHADAEDNEEEEREGTAREGAPRLVKRNNFQEEKATVDVDKHMMAYIEEEMRKRGQETGHPADEKTKGGSSTEARVAAMGEEELYSISEKYKQIQQSARNAIERSKGRMHVAAPDAAQDDGRQREREEGNVAWSTSMLSSVPEIDLGREHRMRNIEATARARKAMEEAMAAQRAKDKDAEVEDEVDYSAARCTLRKAMAIVRLTDTVSPPVSLSPSDANADRCRSDA